MDKFECGICCNQLLITSRGKTQRMVCPGCGFDCCISCQKQYKKDECMKCHMKFKQSFLIEHLGKQFMDKVIKPKIIDELMKDQKETLKYVQPLVDWEKTLREQKKRLRFGIPLSIPERPKISVIALKNVVFPCPVQECRGFVEGGTCGLCKASICLKCREKITEGHVCKIEDLQSIALLSGDSKPCPRCCATIQRTQGCNHMFCTNCRTHFDWVTGAVMQNSSNGHYLNLQRFSQNLPATRNVAPAPTCDAQEFSLFRDKVKKETVDVEHLDKNLFQCIWEDSNTIRLVKRKRYNEPIVESEVTDALQELQVKYLLGEITEPVWSRYVYQHCLKKTMSFLYGDILNIYLASVDIFQQLLSKNIKDQNLIGKQYTELVDLCNNSFKSVQDEYGGPLHHIRHPSEDSKAPAFI